MIELKSRKPIDAFMRDVTGIAIRRGMHKCLVTLLEHGICMTIGYDNVTYLRFDTSDKETIFRLKYL